MLTQLKHMRIFETDNIIVLQIASYGFNFSQTISLPLPCPCLVGNHPPCVVSDLVVRCSHLVCCSLRPLAAPEEEL